MNRLLSVPIPLTLVKPEVMVLFAHTREFLGPESVINIDWALTSHGAQCVTFEFLGFLS